MNGLTLLALIALAIGIVFAYRAGRIAGRREASAGPPPFSLASQPAAPDSTSAAPPQSLSARAEPDPGEGGGKSADGEAERSVLASRVADLSASRYELQAFAEDRRALLSALADARAETARYRQLVVDFENNAPPALLGGPGSPDDLKLIVGVGPMLERMLQQLGITTFRQIARWTEHDIDAFDAKLAEFPGRIRRDGWVVQARSLHQSKYGERA